MPTRVSQETDLRQAIVSHGDPFCFDLCGQRAAFERMARELPLLRGYTDAFGHAQVLGGGVGAMVDLCLNSWDMAATQRAGARGGRPLRDAAPARRQGRPRLRRPALVEQLLGWIGPAAGPASRCRLASRALAAGLLALV